jgi:hypothetical protein
MTTQALEVLDPPLCKSDARAILNRGRRHYRNFTRNAIQFSADLRKLQDGGAHLLYGFQSFGAFAQHEFAGLSADSAKQLSRVGAAALALEAAGRISLDGHGRSLPGTTGLRALATVLHQHGAEAMLATYDRAIALQPDRPLVAESVKRATGELIAPEPTPLLDAPAAPPERDLSDELPDDPRARVDDDEPESVHELRDRVAVLHERLDDLLDALAERKPDEARHVLGEAEAEMREVGEALALALETGQ